jgi:hypothetical protein
MRKLTPLHSRADVIPRPELHAALHDMMHQGGEIKTELFGTLRIDCSVKYQSPAPRNSFAFGQVYSMGLPARDFRIGEHPGTEAGDIIGFDLHQTGHELDAQPFHETATSMHTLPWKEIACRFVPGEDLPRPVGWWLMLRPDPIMTRRLLFASAGALLHVPGGTKGGVATNKGKGTKVKLAAAQVLAFGALANEQAHGHVFHGSWVFYNPMDAIDISYTKGPDGKARDLAFMKWDDLEQVVEVDDA